MPKGNFLPSHLKPQNLNTILKGYIKTNSTPNIFPLFQRLINKTRLPVASLDTYSLLHLLKSCTIRSSSFPLVEGKQIHALILRLGFQTLLVLQTSMINMYSVSRAQGNLQDAHQVFDEISSKNVVCWTTLISAYMHNGNPSRALKIFRQMQMENVDPDRVTVTVALSACADLGALEMGEWIYAYVHRKQGFEMDLCLNNALLNMYMKCGDIATARRMFHSLNQRDVTTWTTMIVGHALHGEAEESLKLFTEMEKMNEKATRADSGDCQSNLIIPNEITFIGVLMACTHAGLVEQGWLHLESMTKKYNLKPQISHYGCMVDLLCRTGFLNEAYRFIVHMPIRPNAVVWRTLLGACRLQENVQLAANAWHRLLELDPGYVGDDVSMSNTYASAGLWDEKEMIRSQIKHRRPPGCSSIEVENQVHEFVATDKNHPLKDVIYEVLEALLQNMKACGYSTMFQICS